MINEKEIQDRVNKRLAGLAASQQRRMRIQAAVSAERKEAQPMKRTISTTLVFAIVAVMLMATAAIAEHFNLFNVFGAHDERYKAVAPYATLTVTEPALIAHPHLGEVKASVDSAYFDGLSLNLAYRIDKPSHVEEFTPTSDELAAMQPNEPLIIALVGNEPGHEIYEAYNAAVTSGTPFGYRQYTVYPSDHTVTDDGVDIPPYSAMENYDETGAYCEMREFETPLPAELNGRNELNVSIKMYQQETAVWFDGQNCFIKYDRSEVGRMDAAIPLTEGAVVNMKGSGEINGVKCEAAATVSQMAASITVNCGAPLNTFLADAPEGTDKHDVWVEVVAVDERGSKLRPQEGIMLDNCTSFTLPLLGTGTLPKTMTVYVYAMWEGIDEPDLAELDGVVMQVVP
ncbi:MAG: hypothetical protein IJ461_01475 [Clostridia bacterium]|nr:hypothetical protein [Clostridia bacterium]